MKKHYFYQDRYTLFLKYLLIIALFIIVKLSIYTLSNGILFNHESQEEKILLQKK